ncbi:hypothetical protein LPJ61_005524, partial [Coemansia biformis]
DADLSAAAQSAPPLLVPLLPGPRKSSSTLPSGPGRHPARPPWPSKSRTTTTTTAKTAPKAAPRFVGLPCASA